MWPSAVGCTRNYTVASEQKDETSVAVRSKQAQEFDWALTKLDSSVRRTGRITKTLLLRIFHDICRTGRADRTMIWEIPGRMTDEEGEAVAFFIFFL